LRKSAIFQKECVAVFKKMQDFEKYLIFKKMGFFIFPVGVLMHGMTGI